jgi:hypothetical protein
VPHHETDKSITAMSLCSLLTGTDKTVINTGIYFQCLMPVYFQELLKYCTETQKNYKKINKHECCVTKRSPGIYCNKSWSASRSHYAIITYPVKHGNSYTANPSCSHGTQSSTTLKTYLRHGICFSFNTCLCSIQNYSNIIQNENKL